MPPRKGKSARCGQCGEKGKTLRTHCFKCGKHCGNKSCLGDNTKRELPI